MSFIEEAEVKQKQYENIRKNYYQKKEDHSKFYKNIIELKNNKNSSSDTKTKIDNYLKLDGRKFAILNENNCCLIGLKNFNYYNFVFSKEFFKYFKPHIFGNDQNLLKEDYIKSKLLNERFMKVETITMLNYDYINKLRNAMNITSEVIILIVQPIDEGIFTKPFWKIYFIGEKGVSGPFDYDQHE